ncbi:TatD family hydrolase [soil metagenome]
MSLLPIDAHAHIKTTVPARDLADLESFVVAVTREQAEWQRALNRHDDLAVWGIGVHPGLPEEVMGFDAVVFAAALNDALFVGEVGLDGRSKAPAAAQRTVFDQILDAIAQKPRPTSIHSVSASRQVLDGLRARPIAAPVLHWWRGSERETEEAVEMGCFFSLNGGEARRPKVLKLLPPERVLTETDFPHSRRSDPVAARPAAVATIEAALMQEWSLDELGLRRRLWRNLAELYDRCELSEKLPPAVQDAILTAGMD